MSFAVFGLLLALVIWHFFITFNSSQVGKKSARRSEKSLTKATRVLAILPTQWRRPLFGFWHRLFDPLYPSLRSETEREFQHFLIRKAAHMTQFFILTLLWLSFWQIIGVAQLNVFVYALAIALLASVLDEFYQHFIPGRSASVIDVLVDFSGGCLAALAFFLFLPFWQ